MPIARITSIGGDLYHVHVMEGGEHPSHGLPGQRPGMVDPGYGQGGRPPHVSNRPPGSGGGGIPDHELPDTPPPQLLPGYTLVLLRNQQGKWEYAAIAPGSPPPRPLPPSSGRPDNTLPGAPVHPGNLPPGTEHPGGGPMPGQPPLPGQPLPPTAAPKPA